MRPMLWLQERRCRMESRAANRVGRCVEAMLHGAPCLEPQREIVPEHARGLECIEAAGRGELGATEVPECSCVEVGQFEPYRRM